MFLYCLQYYAHFLCFFVNSLVNILFKTCETYNTLYEIQFTKINRLIYIQICFSLYAWNLWLSFSNEVFYIIMIKIKIKSNKILKNHTCTFEYHFELTVTMRGQTTMRINNIWWTIFTVIYFHVSNSLRTKETTRSPKTI